MLVCEPDGTIPFPGDKGLYFNDTRIISNWSLYADGVRWDLLSGGAIRHDAMSVHLTNRALVTAAGPVAARTPGLVLGRSIQGGLHGDIGITNHGAAAVRFNLETGLHGSVWPYDNAVIALASAAMASPPRPGGSRAT